MALAHSGIGQEQISKLNWVRLSATWLMPTVPFGNPIVRAHKLAPLKGTVRIQSVALTAISTLRIRQLAPLSYRLSRSAISSRGKTKPECFTPGADAGATGSGHCLAFQMPLKKILWISANGFKLRCSTVSSDRRTRSARHLAATNFYQ